eukprot:TRINITY_DN11539_c0_g2_i2.p4 TRINITY_DN11539_c0_g2~~TRINITY_DN11539_c0_g2_i2.p4  ORF type:complete len:175 (-),score=19.73 TRINITY_DN11539_c0_g2_i2:685-1209(-)
MVNAEETQTFLFSASGMVGLFHNAPFLAGLTALLVAQILKIFTHWYVEGEWDFRRILGSGGMPSSHTALVVGLTAALGYKEGTESDIFALSLIFSIVVMYDACGIRLQAGKHASILNLIVSELPPEHPVSEQSKQPFKDKLGHTPLQVFFGSILGLFVGYIFQVAWIHSFQHKQ